MIVPARRRAPQAINYRRSGVWSGLGVFNPPSRPTFENCDPLDSACVARNQVLSDAYDLAMAQAQAQNNVDQCMANAANATPGAQYDAAVAACHGQYQQQSPTGQAPAYPSERLAFATGGTNSSAAPAASGGRVAFTSSRGSNALQVGDTWLVSITGATPGQPVMATAAGSTTPMGTTDSSGSFSLAGTASTADAGAWNESWSVGGVPSGSFSFTVAPAVTPQGQQVINSSGAGSSSGTGGGTGTGTGTSSGTATSTGFDLSSIPWWGWALAAGAAAFAFSKGGR